MGSLPTLNIFSSLHEWQTKLLEKSEGKLVRSLCKHLYTHLLVSFDRNLGNLKFYLLLKLLISMVIYLRWSAFLKFEFAHENYYKSFPDAESWLFIYRLSCWHVHQSIDLEIFLYFEIHITTWYFTGWQCIPLLLWNPNIILSFSLGCSSLSCQR